MLYRLARRPPALGDQVRRDDRRRPAHALDTVHEHARVRVGQRGPQPRRRLRQVRRELAKRSVLERKLGAVGRPGEGGERDEAAHGREDVGDAEAGECARVFGKGEVGDVEAGEDLGRARWAEGVGRLGDGGRPLRQRGWCGDGHGWWVGGGEGQTGSLWGGYILERERRECRDGPCQLEAATATGSRKHGTPGL